MSRGVPVAIKYKEQIISRLAAGETATEIARSLGLAGHQAISNQLANDPDYQAARVSFHAARLDNVEEDIRDSGDMMSLARAKELATMYRWRAERECPAQYGKAGVNIDTTAADGKISITINEF